MKAEVDLTIKQCPTCGVMFAFPADLYERKVAGHHDGVKQNWFCPNGHSITFAGKSKVEIAEEKLRQTEYDLSRSRQANAQLSDEKRLLQEKNAALVLEEKRLAKRTAGGVCTCCHRTFKQLAAHMRSKHPGQVTEATGQAVGGYARAAALTPEQRKAAAKKAAAARWGAVQ